MLVDPLCNQSKAEQFQITLEKKELPKKANTDSIAETLLSDIFGKKRKKREDVTTTTEAPKGKKDDKVEDYYAYEEDSDYKVDSIGNSTKPGEFEIFKTHTKVSKLERKSQRLLSTRPATSTDQACWSGCERIPIVLGSFSRKRRCPSIPTMAK